MQIVLDRETFDSTPDGELGGACFAPVIPLVRAKSMEVKEEVYRRMTEGQKALFLFYAFYNHACHSMREYFWWCAYDYAQPKLWAGLKEALRYFGAESMREVLEETGNLLEKHGFPVSLEAFSLSPEELDRWPELLPDVQSLYARFTEAAPAALTRIGATIRGRPGEFVAFDNP
ncbi:hypothetical protein [Cohnella caldifontis]|uniref:hypothetical protein n=1 Tax=Cohnella caldifontis TaxID=3027471 RepID=UPI0023EB7CBE|nr:hypothetical protein [Cohnella sp. YIM B05605]